MTSKDPLRRKEIASIGGKAQHKKYGCLIPIESRRKGGRNSGLKQKGNNHKYHGLSEKIFDEKAKENGYIIYKHGFPDRVIEKDGKIVFVEVKHPKSHLSNNQKEMHNLLRRLGLNVVTWKPNMKFEFE